MVSAFTGVIDGILRNVRYTLPISINISTIKVTRPVINVTYVVWYPPRYWFVILPRREASGIPSMMPRGIAITPTIL